MLNLIYSLLRAHAKLTEQQLLKLLHEHSVPAFSNPDLRDPKNLFRCHFLLFNALYQLRDQLLINQQGLLQIDPLGIELKPWNAALPELVQTDSLRSYYLDCANLPTGESKAAELLSGAILRLTEQDKTIAALKVLGFDNSQLVLDNKTIRTRYRQLVCLHHPDRGGDKDKLQEVHQAMDILKAQGIYSVKSVTA
ncbi:DNA-J related domain-containing protein [Pseudomonas sp. F1_0610]|uniref:DNA-J related domain-containing protein n=1 Tax=Pseudomonas sp. F1_0610 TaxID=3114284 RepID=UPI0039C38A0E